MDVFSSLFLRALRVVSPENLDAEINHVFNIGSDLSYPLDFLDKALSLAKQTFYSVPKEKLEFNNILSLPFNENLLTVRHLLKKLNINVVFTYNDTLKKLLVKNSPSSNSNGCVYKIPCSQCPYTYIGQTGRPFEMRLKEHKSYVRNASPNSALFLHFSSFDHPIDWNNSTNIFKVDDWTKRNIIESICINNNTAGMNLTPGLFTLDPIISEKIIKECKLNINQ